MAKQYLCGLGLLSLWRSGNEASPAARLNGGDEENQRMLLYGSSAP